MSASRKARRANQSRTFGERHKIRKQLGIGKGSAPVIERSRRCANCLHWDNGERAIQHYKVCRFRDIQNQAAQILNNEPTSAAAVGARLGDDELPDAERRRRMQQRPDPTRDTPEELMAKLGMNYERGDAMMREGRMGLCLIHAAPGDFTEDKYLCAKWSARVRPDDAEKGDELPEEARERIYGEDK